VHESSATAFDDCASCRASTIAKIATSRVSPFIPVSFQLAISQAGGIRYAVARLPSDPLVSADIRRQVEEPPGLSGPATDAAGRRVTVIVRGVRAIRIAGIDQRCLTMSEGVERRGV